MGIRLDRRPDASLRRVGTTTREAVRRILATFDAATASDLEAGAQWYSEAGELAQTVGWIAGVSQEAGAAIISHLSPRTKWHLNMTDALELAATGDVRRSGAMGGNVGRALHALDVAREGGDALQTFGPDAHKTTRFAANILGDTQQVTVDVWAARVAGVNSENHLKRVGVYDAVEHAYQLAAARRGVSPTTIQATTWIMAVDGRWAD